MLEFGVVRPDRGPFVGGVTAGHGVRELGCDAGVASGRLDVPFAGGLPGGPGVLLGGLGGGDGRLVMGLLGGGDGLLSRPVAAAGVCELCCTGGHFGVSSRCV
nr:MAG TPA: hypothetical protein [Caudoviricetes sp.]